MEEITKQENSNPLEFAEELIALGELDSAQNILNKINEKSGRKYYVQSRLYKKRKWYNEQRKLLQAAIGVDPENEVYKRELSELEEFSKTKEYKKAVKKRQMGSFKERMSKNCSACCDGACAGCSFGC